MTFTPVENCPVEFIPQICDGSTAFFSSILLCHASVLTGFWSETKLSPWNEQRLRRKSAASNPTPLDLTPSASLEVNVSVPPPPAQPAPRQAEEEEVRILEAEEQQSKHVTVEVIPAAPEQASVLPPGVSREELAAIKIQTAFRGYLVMPNQFWTPFGNMHAWFFSLDMFR
jgi:hypothetical protein